MLLLELGRGLRMTNVSLKEIKVSSNMEGALAIAIEDQIEKQS